MFSAIYRIGSTHILTHNGTSVSSSSRPPTYNIERYTISAVCHRVGENIETWPNLIVDCVVSIEWGRHEEFSLQMFAWLWEIVTAIPESQTSIIEHQVWTRFLFCFSIFWQFMFLKFVPGAFITYNTAINLFLGLLSQPSVWTTPWWWLTPNYVLYKISLDVDNVTEPSY